MRSPTGPWTVDELDAMAAQFALIACEAGAAIMPFFLGSANARAKADGSPVCDADETAEALILDRLKAAFPDITIISEEAAARMPPGPPPAAFILCDPLDGTREFLGGQRDFSINIALIVDGYPAAGAVCAPATGGLWCGASLPGQTGRAWKIPASPALDLTGRMALHTRPLPQNAPRLLTSRSHLDPATRAFAAKIPGAVEENLGSSIKFCHLAEGLADIYPRFSSIMEWDTAAGDAVLRAAGGAVTMTGGVPLTYGKPGYRNGAFAAWGDPQAAQGFEHALAQAFLTSTEH